MASDHSDGQPRNRQPSRLRSAFWTWYALIYDAVWAQAANTARIDDALEHLIRTVRPAQPRSNDATMSSNTTASVPLCVDLGCGTGLSARKAHDDGWRVIGVDQSATMLDIAERNRRISDGLQCDAGETPLPDGCAQLVLLSNIMQACPDPQAVIREALRLRAPDGVVVAIWPNDTATLGDVWRDDLAGHRGLAGSCAATVGRLAIGLIGLPLRVRTRDGAELAAICSNAASVASLDTRVRPLGRISTLWIASEADSWAVAVEQSGLRADNG